MKLLILTKRSLVTIAVCLALAATAAVVAVSSTVKAVQTAAEPREIPVYRVECQRDNVRRGTGGDALFFRQTLSEP